MLNGYAPEYVCIRFYSFNPLPHKVERHDNLGKKIGRFVLRPDGMYYTETTKCFYSTQRYTNNSVLELNVPWKEWGIPKLEIAHYLKRVHNIEIKSCSICGHHCIERDDIHCDLQPNIKKPNFYALECPRFELCWLNNKFLKEEDRLHDEDVEIIYQSTK